MMPPEPLVASRPHAVHPPLRKITAHKKAVGNAHRFKPNPTSEEYGIGQFKVKIRISRNEANGRKTRRPRQ